MAEPARSPALPAALDGHAWPAQGNWTYEDYLRLPEDGNRYEIIRGNLYVTAAPYPLHQYVCSRLSLLVGGFIDERKLGILLSAPLDVRLPQRIGDPVQPDLVFLRTGNQPRWETDQSFDGVPPQQVPPKRAVLAKGAGPAESRPPRVQSSYRR